MSLCSYSVFLLKNENKGKSRWGGFFLCKRVAEKFFWVKISQSLPLFPKGFFFLLQILRIFSQVDPSLGLSFHLTNTWILLGYKHGDKYITHDNPKSF